MATQLKRDLRCSEAEWAARQDLAAAYRIFDMLGWGESIYNHITLRVPGEEAFLINPFGLLWSEVTASNLIKIDPDGTHATRVSVKLGRASVSTIEVVQGLQPGDKVIISDMTASDQVDRVRLK